MAEDKMMRLSQVARILNVGISTIVDHLSAKGFKVETNPNTKINAEQIDFLAKDFKSDRLHTSVTAPKPAAAPETPKVEEKRESEFDDILYFRPSGTKPAEKPVEKPVEKVAEPTSIETRLPGIKIVGKIDLDAKRPVVAPKPEVKAEEPVPEPVKQPEQPVRKEETPVAEAPKPVEKTPEAVVEKTVVDVTPVEKATPIQETPKVVEEKVEKPAPVEEKIAPKAEVKEEVIAPKVVTPEPIAAEPVKVAAVEQPKTEEKPVVETPVSTPAVDAGSAKQESKEIKENPTSEKSQLPVVEETVPSELIEAKGQQLRGLRVIGKIELPSEKSKKKDPVASSDAAGDKKRRRKRKRIRDNPAAPAARPPATGAAAATAAPAGSTPTAKPKETTAPAKPAAAGTAAKAKTGRRGPRREEVSEKEVSDNIKATMARMGGAAANTRMGGRGGNKRRRDRADQDDSAFDQEETKVLRVTEFISANELASLMDVTVQEVISVCMNMGMFVSINQRIDAEAITFIADEFGFEVEFISAEEEIQNEVVIEVDKPEDLTERAPIVTIMGHVDHGKTSLLDYIRQENVASGEAGGITQHIGAYSVKTKTGKQVTFLDTPGHEAFTAMRARGAKVTDVVIIVIAADDSVMPQTREAINHAQVAGVPIVFAFSKVDKAGANTEKIREELANMNLLVEEWGGKYQTQEISSKSGLGIAELLEKVLLEAELLELTANPKRKAIGTVVEASLDKGRGYVTTILVQAGTLKVGDIILAGAHHGRVKAMTDHLGKRLKIAGPSTPVQVLGLNGAPQAGDKFNVMEQERDARELANKREQILREQTIRSRKHITLEEIGRRKAIGSFKELNLIVKGDVDGSVEALSDSLLQLSTSEIQINIIHKAVGQISESDVNLAIASDAIIVGFQVRPSSNAKKMAEQEQIEIRHYSVIYNAIEEIKDAMTGMLAPTVEEFVTGNIEIRDIFKISRIGTIAGCYVTDGFVKRNNKIRIIRDGIVIHTGEIDSLKRFKDDVNEVRSGYECGLNIKNFNDIEPGDIIESFELREVKRTL
ncbi:translation initiation factor IF-2 [Arundinibacter roseus]|uniref:Translation initiation factor IF-2 n=1 Tax=Arundinibacter roseus TaxID=2070510 RepID=A0A4R4KMH0_9BACT|nr:translation initiation factor IF-2 [Arundinibacter roseus]TDB67859.1 translation initiation factor IF-2 [Arundinibacter roseus]